MIFIKHILALIVIFELFTTNLYASNAKLLFNGNCTICHKINSEKTAPSILEIKQIYKRAFPLEKDFITQMSIWVNNPKAETSIMLQSSDKFKIMPNLAYDISLLEVISKYIYYTDFLEKNENP